MVQYSEAVGRVIPSWEAVQTDQNVTTGMFDMLKIL